VEQLAQETEQSIGNTSQHLQVLREAQLVVADKRGLRVFYRLAGPEVLLLWQTLRSVGERQLAEIDRLGDDPGMVQVLLCSAGEAPLGRPAYHPIYEACVHHGLPLALHIGGEGAGNSSPATAVGHPSTYFEWYASLPQSYMAHITSMVAEGVFVRFPTLKVVLYEGGVSWLPHIMWRFDKNWKAQRSETPWVRQPPSSYILEHFYSTTYPLEAMPAPQFRQILEMVEAERTLLFSSNYPNWEYGDPFAMIDDIPETMRRRVLVENALAMYGERLTSPAR
jgi:predicted TIM-barrel fold metal-dependent hydrolase